MKSSNKDIDRFLARGKQKEKEPIACVNQYRPGGRQKSYFRLSYFLNGRTRHIHIPGGNVDAPLAQDRAEEIKKAIASGTSIQQLIAAVKMYRGGKSNNSG